MATRNPSSEDKRSPRPSLTHWLEEALVAMPPHGRLTLKAPQELAFGFTDDRKTEKGNQDRVAIAYCLDPNHMGEPWFFAGVCDGVGGEARGEIAASIALTEILSELCTSERVAPQARLSDAILRAHGAVRLRLRGSATTFAGVFVSARGTFTIASVGDSRIYSAGDDEVLQLSQDDTLEDMLRRQAPGGDEARMAEMLNGLKQRWKDSLGQAIGSDLPLEPRTRSWPHIARRTGCFVCTDGVWKTLERVLGQAVAASGDRQDLARRLLNLTEVLRANDNATAVVLPDVRRVLDWLREAPNPSERGLIHIVLPTESIVAPWAFFERSYPPPEAVLRPAAETSVPPVTGTPVKSKSKRKPRASKPPTPEKEAGVQLTIEEEGRDDKTDPARAVSKEQ